MRRLACLVAVLALFVTAPFDQALALLAPFDSSPTLLARGSQSQAPRVVAIGDVHGSIEGLTGILRTAGLIDARGKWIGGKAVLMQTGDYTDRGENVRAVLDLLMALEIQARRAGGRALSLLGNHEVMNLVGETRDANAPIYAKFANAQSESRRTAAWEQYRTLGTAKAAKGEEVPVVLAQTREAFNEAHPIGYVEYREAMGPRGKYGAWLRGKPMVAAFGGSVFMHAGIPPANAPAKLDELNGRVRDEVRRMDRYVQRLVDKKLALPFFTLAEILRVSAAEIAAANTLITAAKESGADVDRSQIDVGLLTEAGEILKIDKWLSLDPEGALWWRGLSNLPDDAAGGPFAPLLMRYSAQRFVTGHTPTQDRRITVRFGGRAVLIDTGMNTAFYQGRASALEIEADRLTAIYEDGRVPLGRPH